MSWCIYTLTDPRDGAVKYVGHSTCPTARLGNHLLEARSAHNRRRRLTPKMRWLLDLDSARLLPLLTVVDWYSTPATFTQRAGLERQWIEAFLEASAPLVNVSQHPVEHARSGRRAWKTRLAGPWAPRRGRS